MNRGARVCLLSAAIAVSALLAAGCGGDDAARAVNATVSVDLPGTAASGTPFDVGYAWSPGDGFEAPADDYRVFVHFVDPDGRIVAQDDHFPPVPTSQWQEGETVEYRRWMYFDPELNPDYYDVFIGLYDEAGQIATMRDGRAQERPLVHTVAMETDNQSGKPVFVEGFYEWETSLDNQDPLTSRWRWMGELGILAFGNPRGPATLHLRLLSQVDLLGGPQTVTIKAGEQTVGSVMIDDSSPRLLRFDLSGEGLGDGDWVDFTIEVDNTLVPAENDPASTDTRRLGTQVFWAYLAPDRSS